MDKKNQQLLDLLKANAREPTASLARKLSLSRTAVYERIAKLEAQGIITGYTVCINQKLQQPEIRAQVMISVQAKQTRHIVANLEKITTIKSLHAVSGEFDFIALVKAHSTEEIDSTLDTIGEMEGIEKTLSSVMLSTKFER